MLYYKSGNACSNDKSLVHVNAMNGTNLKVQLTLEVAWPCHVFNMYKKNWHALKRSAMGMSLSQRTCPQWYVRNHGYMHVANDIISSFTGSFQEVS